MRATGKSLLPQLRCCATLNDFLNAICRWRTNVLRQLVMRKEVLFCDFSVGGWNTRLTPRAHDEKHDVITREGLIVGVNAKELRPAFKPDTGFFV